MNLTIEYSEVKGIDIKPLIKVVVVEMARRVDVSSGVKGQLQLGEIVVGAILHAPQKGEKLANSVRVSARRRIGSEGMSDIVYFSAFVGFLP